MALDVELSEVRDFLAQHHPFDTLPRAVLEALPAQLTIRYFRRGTPLIARGADNNHLYVVRSGAIEISDENGTLFERGGEGTTAGSVTLVLGNPSVHEVVAYEDTLALVMESATFYELCRGNPEFAHFFEEQRAQRMGGAVARQQLSSTGSAVLKTNVMDLVRREPVTAPVTATIHEAAQVMATEGVSCLLLTEGASDAATGTQGRLAGIVTDRDLRNRVVAPGIDLGRPVTDVMTADPVTAGSDALAFELLLEMVDRRIHHLPVVEDGRPVGVITTTDLMRLEHANPVYLVGDIAKQPDIAGIAERCRRLPLVVEGLVAADASAEDIGRVVTAVGDAVERRLVQLAEDRLGPAPAAYCWVTLGSRARREQALAADQDHALILADTVTEEQRGWFVELASFVTDGLVECGYPRCDGDVMATNPRWRKPLAEWIAEFRSWLTEPVPDAVLQASIFFDMRPVSGDEGLYAALAGFVRREGPQSGMFLAHLAKQATLNEPPLGFFRGFVVDKSGEHKDTLDIKRGGIGAVVELARVYALGLGTEAVNTPARIQAARLAGIIGAERAEELRDAYEFISYVRLRHQVEQVRAGEEPDNRIKPAALSPADKRHLREAFGIVRSAQTALGGRYPLHFVS
jgi:CBS domain-containing protein